jgi:hypothetical protein
VPLPEFYNRPNEVFSFAVEQFADLLFTNKAKGTMTTDLLRAKDIIEGEVMPPEQYWHAVGGWGTASWEGFEHMAVKFRAIDGRAEATVNESGGIHVLCLGVWTIDEIITKLQWLKETSRAFFSRWSDEEARLGMFLDILPSEDDARIQADNLFGL